MAWQSNSGKPVAPDHQPRMGVTIDSHSICDIGRRRDLNEDQCVLSENPAGPTGVCVVAVVADGMGGHDAGDVASKITRDGMDHLFIRGGSSTLARDANVSPDDIPSLLRLSMIYLHEKIMERARTFKLQRTMGSTCVAAVLRREAGELHLHVGWVGDSRCYIVRRSKIMLATEDDSLVWSMYRKGTIGFDDMRTHPQRNILTQALGSKDTLQPHVRSMRLAPGDSVLLCSDGVHGAVQDREILSVIQGSRSSHEACERLVAAANQAGGKDNITAVVVRVLAESASTSPRDPLPTKRSAWSYAVLGVAVIASAVGSFLFLRSPDGAATVTDPIPRPVMRLSEPTGAIHTNEQAVLELSLEPPVVAGRYPSGLKVAGWVGGRAIDTLPLSSLARTSAGAYSMRLRFGSAKRQPVRFALIHDGMELASTESIIEVRSRTTAATSPPRKRLAVKDDPLPIRLTKGLDGKIQVWLESGESRIETLDVELTTGGAKEIVSLTRRNRTIPKATLLRHSNGATVSVRAVGRSSSENIVLR